MEWPPQTVEAMTVSDIMYWHGRGVAYFQRREEQRKRREQIAASQQRR